jgi:hypothetical protein
MKKVSLAGHASTPISRLPSLCILVFLALAFFLSACGLVKTDEEKAPSGAILYQDDFSDPGGGWLRYGEENGAMDYFGGAYRIIVIAPDYDLWAVSGHSFSNVSLEVDAGPLGGPLDDRFGLICRYTDPENFYFFVISADGFYGLGKVINGERILLNQEMMAHNASIRTGFTFNHIRFECKDNSLIGLVNDQALAVAMDDTLASGDVGLLAGSFDTPGVDIAFDNFVVKKP